MRRTPEQRRKRSWTCAVCGRLTRSAGHLECGTARPPLGDAHGVGQLGTSSLFPGHAERIERYRLRAERGLPLFGE